MSNKWEELMAQAAHVRLGIAIRADIEAATSHLIDLLNDLDDVNSALMSERTSLIATKREQLKALTAERDMWRARALDLTR